MSEPGRLRPELRDEYEAGRNFERRFGDKAEPAERGRFAEPRSWTARTADEVRAWFGDREALRRRQWDSAAGDHAGEGPATEMDEDAQIQADLTSALARDRSIDARDVRIAVNHGSVDLDGAVRVSADRMVAETTAWKIKGVVAVRNNLTIG